MLEWVAVAVCVLATLSARRNARDARRSVDESRRTCNATCQLLVEESKRVASQLEHFEQRMTSVGRLGQRVLAAARSQGVSTEP